MDVSAAGGSGHLIFVTGRTPMLRGGEGFDPDHLIGATLKAGYSGLRLSADVPWISRGVPGEERMLKFETLADRIVNNPGILLLVICSTV